MPAKLAAVDEHDTALDEQSTSDKERDEVFDRAMERFDLAVFPQLEQRSLSLAARRFVSIPGAQWEGDFSDAFDEAIKLEINLTKDGLDKIYRDYNENRIVPDFRPSGDKGDDDSADTLDGMHRADSACFKAQQARDNAFIEGTAGGFGAYRLTNEWADPYDPDSDAQRINPGLAIVDADQRVFFDPDAILYDKSDARFCFVITAKSRERFEDENPDVTAPTDWPDNRIDPVYDWYTPDIVKVAEYYEVEDVTEKQYILTHILSGEEQRYWASELDDDELSDMKKSGWKARSRELKRRRVHKYVISGQEVLEDRGILAGDRIPIVPYYGKRSYVDGVERFEGYVQSKMDVQRLYNMAVSKIAETSAQSPRSIPIFASQQMPSHLADLWSRQLVERHAYALVDPLLNPVTGDPIATGPIGMIEPAQIDGATAAVVQIARNDLTADQQDGSDEAKANTSEEALQFAATRVDAKSGIFLDNWRQSVQCEGEVYLSMCADIYYEPDRDVETMSEDDDFGSEKLVQQYVDKAGRSKTKNDFTRGRYQVVVSATEATATRREKTVRSALNLSAAAQNLGDNDLGQAALVTAIANMDGEGMNDLQEYARRKGISLGLIEPTEEEQAALDKANQDQQPDPAVAVATAQAEALHEQAGKLREEQELTKAKTDESRASAVEKIARAKHESVKPRLSLFQRFLGNRPPADPNQSRAQ